MFQATHNHHTFGLHQDYQDEEELQNEGIQDYFKQFLKQQEEEEGENKGKELEFSPNKRKKGWQCIGNAILNPQSTQHKIFYENIMKEYLLQHPPKDDNNEELDESDYDGDYMARRKRNKKCQDQRIIKYCQKVKKQLEDLDQLKNSLKTYQIGKQWQSQIRQENNKHQMNESKLFGDITTTTVSALNQQVIQKQDGVSQQNGNKKNSKEHSIFNRLYEQELQCHQNNSKRGDSKVERRLLEINGQLKSQQNKFYSISTKAAVKQQISYDDNNIQASQESKLSSQGEVRLSQKRKTCPLQESPQMMLRNNKKAIRTTRIIIKESSNSSHPIIQRRQRSMADTASCSTKETPPDEKRARHFTLPEIVEENARNIQNVEVKAPYRKVMKKGSSSIVNSTASSQYKTHQQPSQLQLLSKNDQNVTAAGTTIDERRLILTQKELMKPYCQHLMEQLKKNNAKKRQRKTSNLQIDSASERQLESKESQKVQDQV